jgi:hypothetical protein
MRLDEELQDRTKRFASSIVRLYVALQRQRKEVEVLGHQFLRSGTSVAARQESLIKLASIFNFSTSQNFGHFPI